MTPSEIKEEMERIWKSRGVAFPVHFTRWQRPDFHNSGWVRNNLKIIPARGKKAIANNPKRAK